MCVCVCVCVCVSVGESVCVCPPHRTKTGETTITKLAPGIVRHESILGQKVKGQGHTVTKCKNIFQEIEWPAWVCTSIECPSSSLV